jgi:hypothetical protein
MTELAANPPKYIKFQTMVTWLVLLIGFALTITSAVISFNDKNKEFKNGKQTSKSFKTTFAIAIIGGLLTLLSSINSNYEKEKSSVRAKELTDSLFKSNSKLISSQALTSKLLLEQKDSTSKIINSQDRIIKLNDNLYNANLKIQSLQGEVINNITGNGNVPVLVIAPATFSRDHYMLQLQISNMGTTPVRGLKAILIDAYSDIIMATNLSGDSMNNSFTGYSVRNPFDNYDTKNKLLNKEILIGDLPSKSTNTFYYPQIPQNIKWFSFSVKIQWDNGFIYCDFEGEKQEKKKFPKLWIRAAGDQKGAKTNPTFIRLVSSSD